MRLVRLRSGTTIVVPKSTDTYGMSSGGTWLRLLLYFSNRTATPLTWMSKIVECIWVFIVRPESGEIEGQPTILDGDAHVADARVAVKPSVVLVKKK